MKFSKKTVTIAAVLAISAPLCLGMAAPSLAGTPSATPLIDKDFEVALRKFISKRFFNRINATDEQREKLSKIMADTQDETRASREEFRQGVLDLSAMMADEKATDDQIKSKVKELRSLHEKVQDRRISSMLEARKVLTPEQRQQIHGKISELITGGIKPGRRVGFLLRGGQSFLGE